MSSIWNSAIQQPASSPFATTGTAPLPGGVGAAKFQSLLQSLGASGASSSSSSSPVSSGLPAGAATAATAGSGSGTSSSTDTSTGITANDFLTLLVTEMQNQDPTAQTDPNEYINQLVQINSLEQLISINQNLSEVLGAATSPAPSSSAGSGAVPSTHGPVTMVPGVHAVGPAPIPVRNVGTGLGGGAGSTIAGGLLPRSTSHATVSGNLALPENSPAATTVSRSLDGHRTAVRAGHGIRDIPTR